MRTLSALVFFLATLLPASGFAPIAPADGARPSSESLRAKHAELRERLASSPFGRPLLLTAAEDRHRVSGDAYAVLEHPFAQASDALADPAQWCEILLLPFNTKQCEAARGSADSLALTVHVGRKYSTALENTHRLDFSFTTPARAADYLRVELDAPTGPFGTREYKIVFELAPMDERRSFLHFGYSYGYGAIARAAMQAYLSTIGASKVGFTTEGAAGNGKPALVRGMRGVMERNTMRYYLAIEAYLRARGVSAPQRDAKMIEDWFAAVERYPRQLRELDHDVYVDMKVREFARMHGAASPGRRTASSSP